MRETSEFTHTELDSVDFSDIDLIPVESKSTISDVFKVRINGKWHFLKRPKKEFSTHPVFISAIKKEFDIGYSLNHSGISRYESVGNDSQGIYLLSEWVDGFTLEDFIRKNPDYFKDATNRRKFVTQICSALSYLHGRQVLHLDLKPSNIMITKINHDVKLIDLGFAYSDCYQFETSGKSEAYAAPEQLAEGGEINELTDIYSLGLVLEYALTGRTDEEAMKLLPRQWSRAVARCRNENPADRPRSVDEVMNIVLKRSYAFVWWAALVVVILLAAGALLLQKDKNGAVVQVQPPAVTARQVPNDSSLDTNAKKLPQAETAEKKTAAEQKDKEKAEEKQPAEVKADKQAEQPAAEKHSGIERDAVVMINSNFAPLAKYSTINETNRVEAGKLLNSLYAKEEHIKSELMDNYGVNYFDATTAVNAAQSKCRVLNEFLKDYNNR